jgi:hypothetical protein
MTTTANAVPNITRKYHPKMKKNENLCHVAGMHLLTARPGAATAPAGNIGMPQPKPFCETAF